MLTPALPAENESRRTDGPHYVAGSGLEEYRQGKDPYQIAFPRHCQNCVSLWRSERSSFDTRQCRHAKPIPCLQSFNGTTLLSSGQGLKNIEVRISDPDAMKLSVCTGSVAVTSRNALGSEPSIMAGTGALPCSAVNDLRHQSAYLSPLLSNCPSAARSLFTMPYEGTLSLNPVRGHEIVTLNTQFNGDVLRITNSPVFSEWNVGNELAEVIEECGRVDDEPSVLSIA